MCRKFRVRKKRFQKLRDYNSEALLAILWRANGSRFIGVNILSPGLIVRQEKFNKIDLIIHRLKDALSQAITIANSSKFPRRKIFLNLLLSCFGHHNLRVDSPNSIFHDLNQKISPWSIQPLKLRENANTHIECINIFVKYTKKAVLHSNFDACRALLYQHPAQ